MKRGKKSKYFPQHDSNCNGIEFKECQDKVKADWEGKSCNCTKIHDNHYKITTDSSLKPVSEYLKAAKFHSIIGAGNDYASYIVPDNDVNSRVSIPEENVGDHYEEAISPSRDFGSTFLKAVKKLMENKGK